MGWQVEHLCFLLSVVPGNVCTLIKKETEELQNGISFISPSDILSEAIKMAVKTSRKWGVAALFLPSCSLAALPHIQLQDSYSGRKSHAPSSSAALSCSSFISAVLELASVCHTQGAARLQDREGSFPCSRYSVSSDVLFSVCFAIVLLPSSWQSPLRKRCRW